MERRIEQLSHTLIEGYEQEQAKMLEREELRKKKLLEEKKKRERELDRMETKARQRAMEFTKVTAEYVNAGNEEKRLYYAQMKYLRDTPKTFENHTLSAQRKAKAQRRTADAQRDTSGRLSRAKTSAGRSRRTSIVSGSAKKALQESFETRFRSASRVATADRGQGAREFRSAKEMEEELIKLETELKNKRAKVRGRGGVGENAMDQNNRTTERA